MPYITQDKRVQIYESGKYIDVRKIETAGDMQYAIAEMIDAFIMYGKDKLNYQKMNDIMGALAGAQQEFYRKVVAPYEDQKIADNGAVYNLEYYLHNSGKGEY